jgi:sterol desaturase/sphingolipid hydroxylase (fatty acid hydroxylase superfamily)
MQAFMDNLVHLYHTDDTFYKISVLIPVVSTGSFLAQAIPLSLLVLWNPKWLQGRYIKGRAQNSEILSMMFWGLFYSVFNHAVLFGALAALYPYYEPVVKRAMVWDDNVSWITITSAVQLVITFYLEDMFYYNIHKTFHTNKFLFNNVHALHHSIRRPIAMIGHYMSPQEFFAIGGTVLFTPFLLGFVGTMFGMNFPVHYKLMLLWLGLRQWEAAEEHCGFEAPFLIAKYIIPLYDGPAFHFFHHTKVVGNYGAVTAVWDKFFGTVSKGYDNYAKGSPSYEPDAPL